MLILLSTNCILSGVYPLLGSILSTDKFYFCKDFVKSSSKEIPDNAHLLSVLYNIYKSNGVIVNGKLQTFFLKAKLQTICLYLD